MNNSSNNRRPASNLTQPNNNNNSNILYRPQIYKYKCRGALHINDHNNSHPKNNNNDEDELPLCRGIQSKLQHVTDLPIVSSKNDAIQLFDEFIPTRQYESMGDDGDKEDVGWRNHYEVGKKEEHEKQHQQHPKMKVSCYGTTEVNVLTLQEMETSNHERNNPLFPGVGGRMSPFDPFSMFSAFENAEASSNEQHHDQPKSLFDQFGGDAFSKASGGMRSVSTSSRTTIKNGKRVTTTETTTVNPDGKRITKKEVTVHNPDGTKETTVTNNDNDNAMINTKGIPQNNDPTHSHNYHPNPASEQDIENFFSSMMPPPLIKRSKEPEITAIAPECKLGVSISNVEKERHGDTIISVRVGPLEVAIGDSYDIVDGGENDTKDKKLKEDEAMTTTNTTSFTSILPSPATLVKFQSNLERTANSMKKNAEVIKDELKDDFPSRVYKGGEKVVNNFGKTLDRAGKLAGDLYRMWSREDDD